MGCPHATAQILISISNTSLEVILADAAISK